MSMDEEVKALVEFILARVAEWEAMAQRFTMRHWAAVGDYTVGGDSGVAGSESPDGTQWGVCRTATAKDAEYIAAHDPARVLAQCAAYRGIVERIELRRIRHNWTTTMFEMLLVLAATWADHPDYRRKEWAV